MFVELKRAASLGAKFGLKGIAMYTDASVETPKVDETAMEGAVGIVVTLAAVIIALYIDSPLDRVWCRTSPQSLSVA